MTIAQAVAMTVDAGELLRIPLDKDGIASQPYKAIEEKLLRIKELDPSLAYVYILKKTEREGVLRFIIDIHPCEVQMKLIELLSRYGEPIPMPLCRSRSIAPLHPPPISAPGCLLISLDTTA